MNLKLFKKAWFGSFIDGARELEKKTTFNQFIFEELPPIRKDLNSDFSWLPPYLMGYELVYPEMQFKEDEDNQYANGVNYFQQLGKLEQELNSYGISLPNEIKRFLTTESINSRIRSTTDNYFEIGDYIEIIQETETYYLLHFMSDSQYCLLWYICFDEKGNHFIVVSPKLYGHNQSENHNKELENYEPQIGYYCAHNFLEFIYRYDLEQRIWLKKKWFKAAELNEEEKSYIKHYLDLKNQKQNVNKTR